MTLFFLLSLKNYGDSYELFFVHPPRKMAIYAQKKGTMRGRFNKLTAVRGLLKNL